MVDLSVEKEQEYLKAFRSKLESYSLLSETTWTDLEREMRFLSLTKHQVLLRNGDIAKDMYFVCAGALRAFFTDSNGNIYSKNIFLEHDLAGSMASAIRKKSSEFTIESLEDVLLIAINFDRYKALMELHLDLKNCYLAYLEEHWLIQKEQREISLVMENAFDRYQDYLIKYPGIERRISQHYIASHLGITPTQLSRIRKKMKENL